MCTRRRSVFFSLPLPYNELRRQVSDERREIITSYDLIVGQGKKERERETTKNNLARDLGLGSAEGREETKAVHGFGQ